MRIQFLAIILIGCIQVSAQLGVGTATPEASAQLDVNSSSKGFLPPRIALTATNSASPVTSPAAGLLVYNTATAGVAPNNVTPGYYYYSSGAWIRIQAGTVAGTDVSGGSNRQVLTSNGSGGASWGKKILAGTILFGDINSGADQFVTVSGDIVSAYKQYSGNRAAVTIPDMGSTNYTVLLTIESTKTGGDPVNIYHENDMATPVIYDKTSSTFRIFFEETASVAQTTKINVLIVSF